MVPSEPKQIQIPNGKVSYLHIECTKEGSGTPLILIHGFTNHYKDWNSTFLEGLTSHFELFLVNNRGIGHSFSSTTTYTIEDCAQDLVCLIRQLPFPQVAVLGYSLGGYIAQEIAKTIPDKICGLILLSTRMGGRYMTQAHPKVLEILTKTYASQKEKDIANLSILAPEEFQGNLQNHANDVASLPLGDDTLVTDEIKDLQNRARIQWLENFTGEHAYQEFLFPTLILAGNRDIIIPPENAIEMARAIPHSWLIRIPRGGHALSTQFPKEISQYIRNFASTFKSSN